MHQLIEMTHSSSDVLNVGTHLCVSVSLSDYIDWPCLNEIVNLVLA